MQCWKHAALQPARRLNTANELSSSCICKQLEALFKGVSFNQQGTVSPSKTLDTRYYVSTGSSSHWTLHLASAPKLLRKTKPPCSRNCSEQICLEPNQCSILAGPCSLYRVLKCQCPSLASKRCCVTLSLAPVIVLCRARMQQCSKTPRRARFCVRTALHSVLALHELPSRLKTVGPSSGWTSFALIL